MILQTLVRCDYSKFVIVYTYKKDKVQQNVPKGSIYVAEANICSVLTFKEL